MSMTSRVPVMLNKFRYTVNYTTIDGNEISVSFTAYESTIYKDYQRVISPAGLNLYMDNGTHSFIPWHNIACVNVGGEIVSDGGN